MPSASGTPIRGHHPSPACAFHGRGLQVELQPSRRRGVTRRGECQHRVQVVEGVVAAFDVEAPLPVRGYAVPAVADVDPSSSAATAARWHRRAPARTPPAADALSCRCSTRWRSPVSRWNSPRCHQLWNAKPLSGAQSASRDASHAMPSTLRPCISFTWVLRASPMDPSARARARARRTRGPANRGCTPPFRTRTGQARSCGAVPTRSTPAAPARCACAG